MSKLRVVMLAGTGLSTNAIYNAIQDHVEVVAIYLERKPSLWSFLVRRARRRGIFAVAGQCLFMFWIRVKDRLNRRQLLDLSNRLGLCDQPLPCPLTRKTESVNSPEVSNALAILQPDVVLINGTRILLPEVLASVQAPFINVHMGITPRYRGVHGGYWALANSDRENCGVTVHLVDRGIDTGQVLYQARIEPEIGDYFSCYPLRQLAAALPLLIRVLKEQACGQLRASNVVGPSRLWMHPTLCEYLRIRRSLGVL